MPSSSPCPPVESKKRPASPPAQYPPTKRVKKNPVSPPTTSAKTKRALGHTDEPQGLILALTSERDMIQELLTNKEVEVRKMASENDHLRVELEKFQKELDVVTTERNSLNTEADLRLKFEVEQAQELTANALAEDCMRRKLAGIAAEAVALHEEKARLTADITGKSEALQSMAVEKVDLERKVAHLQASLQLAQDSTQSFERKAKSRSQEISRLRMEQQRAVSIINRHPNFSVSNDSRKILEAVIYLLKEYDDLEDDYDQVGDDYDKVEDKYDRLRDNYHRLEGDLDVTSDALVAASARAGKIPGLEAKVSQLESANTRLESARATVATLEGKLESAKMAVAEVPRLREMVAKLEGERDKHMHNLSSIRGILGRLGSPLGGRHDEGPAEGGHAAMGVTIKKEF